MFIKKLTALWKRSTWIIWQMTGEETRSACGAGYKAFYRHDSGYPTKDFFKALDPAMENIVEEKLDAPIKSIGETAGYLTDSMARRTWLLAGTLLEQVSLMHTLLFLDAELESLVQ